jgi:hypothetical protein
LNLPSLLVDENRLENSFGYSSCKIKSVNEYIDEILFKTIIEFWFEEGGWMLKGDFNLLWEDGI